ncbi:hypothetical protein PISMIDRAFT_671699 [Pisolithus microcarpus 441]|uniref:Uncharacterized protein n=1 Tax=Pisolithus microcarpus 441 TaxID=765257 RepID=A0A0C9YX92_9AGAM|nr:hypothetical protein BKA83DRAFT_671699 [Pisolithus microcarpus]KIK29750.1 hypothetical protein PISMIDRAFT_671699 [Pisolithus microcarpus 441]
MDDRNPRPQKRLRTDPNLVEIQTEMLDSHLPSALPPSILVPPAEPPSPTFPCLKPLPPQVLLLALPALLLHPPTHEKYPLSLFLSLRALRLCLQLPALAPDVECYAWTALAEVGMRVIKSGFCKTGEHGWTIGLEEEVEKAIGKGLLLAQKHPVLRHLRHHLSLLNAHFAFYRSNTRFARAVLRRLISTFVPSDPPTIVYAAHLALVTQLTSSPPTSQHSQGNGTNESIYLHPPTNPPEVQASLTALTNLSAIAAQNQHFSMVKLVAVLRLRVLVAAEMWEMVRDALQAAEKLLLLAFDDSDGAKEGGQESGVKREGSEFLSRSHSITSQEVHDSAASQFRSQTPLHMEPDDKARTEQPSVDAKDPQEDSLTAALSVHTLMLGIVYHTHHGRARAAEPRLAALHSLMDSGAPVGGVHSDGLVEVPLSPYPPIHLRVSHPRVIFLLTFLISAVAKRDPVGRRPKKKVFAESGIVNCREGCDEDGGRAVEINVPPWSSHGDVENIDQTTLKIEADLLCELAAVSIQRCDFDAAGKHLDTVVAHTRTHGFFPKYAPRITLHYAHLAHAIGDTDRAGTCYRVAAYLDGAGPVGTSNTNTSGFVAAAARAGEVLLRIGLAAKQAAPNTTSDPPAVTDEQSHAPYLDESTVALAEDAIARCSTCTSAPLPALAEILSAALSPSQIIRSKSLLKHALALSGSAGDNHMRALVLAVVGAQYVHTAPEHAMEVLAVCETLGAGMGASEKKPVSTDSDPGTAKGASVCGMGNAALRLWVGERFLELFKRTGKEKRAQKQEEFNAMYRFAVDAARTVTDVS